MLSAKFANSSVNQSHSATANTKPRDSVPAPEIHSKVTSALPTSTTNMTGFFH